MKNFMHFCIAILALSLASLIAMPQFFGYIIAVRSLGIFGKTTTIELWSQKELEYQIDFHNEQIDRMREKKN